MSYVNDTYMGIKAEVTLDSYLGIGFGTDMVDTDMIIFQAYSTTPVFNNYYSTDFELPSPES